MDSFDKFVKRHCCKLSDVNQLKTGFKTKGQMKDALIHYKDRSLQRDFGGVDMSRKSLTTLALKVLEPEPLLTKSISLPTNYAHRPQQLVARVPIAESVEAEVQDSVNDLINLEENLNQLNEEYLAVKTEREEGAGSSAGVPPTEREQQLEDQIQDLRQQIADNRSRNRVEQNVLAQREIDALEDVARAQRSVERETVRTERAKEQAVRNLPASKLKEYIDINWGSVISIRMPEMPKSMQKSKSVLMGMKGKAAYLLDVLGIPADEIYGETVGFDEVFDSSREGTPEPEQRELAFGSDIEVEEEEVRVREASPPPEPPVEPPSPRRLTPQQERMIAFSREMEESN